LKGKKEFKIIYDKAIGKVKFENVKVKNTFKIYNLTFKF